jgi:hypothetical protein
MTQNDDIPGEMRAIDSEPTVGPESETRGGPEAPADTLDDRAPAPMPDGRPGLRAGLPPGRLPGPYLGPQGDENRDPPANAPSPTGPANTV